MTTSHQTKSDGMIDSSNFEIESVIANPDRVSMRAKDGRSLTLTRGKLPHAHTNAIPAMVFGAFFGYGAMSLTGNIALCPTLLFPNILDLRLDRYLE